MFLFFVLFCNCVITSRVYGIYLHGLRNELDFACGRTHDEATRVCDYTDSLFRRAPTIRHWNLEISSTYFCANPWLAACRPAVRSVYIGYGAEQHNRGKTRYERISLYQSVDVCCVKLTTIEFFSLRLLFFLSLLNLLIKFN